MIALKETELFKTFLMIYVNSKSIWKCMRLSFSSNRIFSSCARCTESRLQRSCFLYKEHVTRPTFPFHSGFTKQLPSCVLWGSIWGWNYVPDMDITVTEQGVDRNWGREWNEMGFRIRFFYFKAFHKGFLGSSA